MRHRHKFAAALLALSSGIVTIAGNNAVAQAATKYPTAAVGKPTTPKPHPLSTPTTITVGIPAKSELFSGLAVAQQMGEFAKTNLTVNVVVDPSGGTSEPQELAQGTIQVAYTGISAGMLNAIYDGIPVVDIGSGGFPNPNAMAGFYVNTQFLTSNGTLIKTKAPTFNVSIGVSGVSGSQAGQVETWLEKSHVTLSDVHEEALGTPTIVTALENGALDAGWVGDPFWHPLVGNTQFKLVYPSVWGTEWIGVYKPWADAHKAVVEAFIRALIRTDRTYLKAGYYTTPKVMAIYSSFLGVPVSTIELTPAPVNSTDYSTSTVAQGVKAPPTTVVLTLEQKAWIAAGGVLQSTKPQKSSKLIDSTFQVAALK